MRFWRVRNFEISVNVELLLSLPVQCSGKSKFIRIGSFQTQSKGFCTMSGGNPGRNVICVFRVLWERKWVGKKIKNKKRKKEKEWDRKMCFGDSPSWGAPKMLPNWASGAWLKPCRRESIALAGYTWMEGTRVALVTSKTIDSCLPSATGSSPTQSLLRSTFLSVIL